MGGLVDFIKWIQTRIVKPQIGFLYLLLLIALWFCQPSSNLMHFLSITIFTATLLISFRLWDDIADRQFDQNHALAFHNERVIVKTQHIAYLKKTCLGLLLLTAVPLYLWYEKHAIILYACLCTHFLIIYNTPVLRNSKRTIREILVLIKYPVFILVLAHEINTRTVLVACVVYGVLLLHTIYERHQASLGRISKTSQ